MPRETLNGISDDALLTVLVDRLEAFQAETGEAICRENAIALRHIKDAIHWLRQRSQVEMGETWKRGMFGDEGENGPNPAPQ